MHAATEVPLEVTSEDSPLEGGERGGRVRLQLVILVEHDERELLDRKTRTVLQGTLHRLETGQSMVMRLRITITYQASGVDGLGCETTLQGNVEEGSLREPAMLLWGGEVPVRQMIPALNHIGVRDGSAVGWRKEVSCLQIQRQGHGEIYLCRRDVELDGDGDICTFSRGSHWDQSTRCR